jgi:hypothetical protein
MPEQPNYSAPPGRPHRGLLPDFRNLAFCNHRPWPTVDRRLGLVCVECRRHLCFDVPEFGGLPFYIAIQVFYEGPFVSDDGTPCAIFALAKAADAILGVGLRLLVIGEDV